MLPSQPSSRSIASTVAGNRLARAMERRQQSPRVDVGTVEQLQRENAALKQALQAAEQLQQKTNATLEQRNAALQLELDASAERRQHPESAISVLEQNFERQRGALERAQAAERELLASRMIQHLSLIHI